MKEILTNEVQTKLDNGEKINIIDVREDGEVAKGKIPEAKHIPLGELLERLGDLNKDDHYYMICQVGGRSGKAAVFLEEKGYHATNIIDGMEGWKGKVE